VEIGGSSTESMPTADPAARGRSRRPLVVGCAIAAVIVAILLYVGLSFLGGQVREILKGTVQFGTGGSGCDVTGDATTFAPGQDIHVVANLSRDVKAGEVLAVEITHDGIAEAPSSRTLDATANCISGTLPSTVLQPARYRIVYSVGSEVVARGEFVVSGTTPS
jgi:hypothetical protein